MCVPEFVMLVGLPGAGKSEYAKELAAKGYHVHSSDELRLELYGDVNDQEHNGKLFEEMNRRSRNDLKAGISCVYDATNLSMKKRMAFLREIRKISCHKRVILFVIPAEICGKNVKNCDKIVPDYVYEKFLRQFQCPYYYEGWDEIEVKWYDGDEEYEDCVDDVTDFEQDNSHHSMTLGDHMEAALFYCMAHDFSFETSIAALYHDVGKYYTKSFKNSKGEVTSEAHYYNHHNYGAYMFLVHFIKVMREVYEDLDKGILDQVLYIVCLIQWHMAPYMAWEQSKKARERDRQMLGEKMYQDIMNLHEADEAAH